MLYRVAKVYGNQENLKIMLSKIEDHLGRYNDGIREHLPPNFSTPYTSPAAAEGITKAFQMESPILSRRSMSSRTSCNYSGSVESYGISSTMLAHIRAIMREMEDVDFQYQPIFSHETKVAVSESLPIFYNR